MKIRAKILFLALTATAILAAGLFLAQMWFDFIDWEIFVKSQATLLIVGTLSSFLLAVDYDLPGSRSKLYLAALVGLAVGAAALAVSQMWFTFLAWELFGKSFVTLLVLAVLMGVLLALGEDFMTNKKLRDNKYID